MGRWDVGRWDAMQPTLMSQIHMSQSTKIIADAENRMNMHQ